jgi:hypothetical protein
VIFFGLGFSVVCKSCLAQEFKSELSFRWLISDIWSVLMVWYELDCSESGQGPVEGSCEHGNDGNEQAPFREMMKFLSSCITGGFWRRSQMHGIS